MPDLLVNMLLSSGYGGFFDTAFNFNKKKGLINFLISFLKDFIYFCWQK
jgi:hypothetical protein